MPTVLNPNSTDAGRFARPGACGVKLERVSKTFGEPGVNLIHAVSDLSVDLAPGSFTSFVGPSGCGKSTVIRIIAGLELPTTGTRTLLPTEPNQTPRLAYVFQDANLLPWRSVLGNVELPLLLQHVDKRQRQEQALAAIERVGLSQFIGKYPMQLSGGMRMRVSLARAMVSQPDVLLLDEPFAALDEITRQQLDDQLLNLWDGSKMTVIFVTHSIAEAAYLSERVFVFSARPGRVVLDHTLDLPGRRAASLRVEPAFARESGVLFNALQQGFKG